MSADHSPVPVRKRAKARIEPAPPVRKDPAGPWILPKASLEELSKILAEAWPALFEAAVQEAIPHQLDLLRIRKSGEEASEDAARAAAATIVNQLRTQECEITLRDGTKALHASLADALKDRTLATIQPKGVKLQMSAGSLSLRITIDNRVNVSCSPSSNSQLRALEDDVLDWVDAKAPKRLVRLWHDNAPFPAIMLVCFLPALYSIKVPVTPLPEDDTRSRATALLVDGVAPEEIPAALELLLQKAFGLPERVAPIYQMPKALSIGLLFGGIVALLLLIRPTSCIGIGKGQGRCVRMALWIRVVGVLMPAYIIGNLVLPTIWSHLFG